MATILVIDDEAGIRFTIREVLQGPDLRVSGRVENLPCHSNLHYPAVENFVAAVLDVRTIRLIERST